jgi:hypothetical protein
MPVGGGGGLGNVATRGTNIGGGIGGGGRSTSTGAWQLGHGTAVAPGGTSAQAILRSHSGQLAAITTPTV